MFGCGVCIVLIFCWSRCRWLGIWYFDCYLGGLLVVVLDCYCLWFDLILELQVSWFC